MTQEILVAQLRATQASARALAENIEAILKSLEERVAAPPPSKKETPPQPPSSLDPKGVCTHPDQMRRPAGVMGAPKRFLCQLCERTIDPDHPEEVK